MINKTDNTRKIATITTWLFAACVTLNLTNHAYADSLEKANQQDITMLLHTASTMHSAYSASLIGEVHGRVYIEYVTAIHASSLFTNQRKIVVYWIPRAEITDDQLSQFQQLKTSKP